MATLHAFSVSGLQANAVHCVHCVQAISVANTDYLTVMVYREFPLQGVLYPLCTSLILSACLLHAIALLIPLVKLLYM